MGPTVQVVYENGILRPLKPLDYTEGQQLSVTILTREEEDEIIKQALGDLIVHWPEGTDQTDAEIEAEIDEIFGPFQGDPPLSQYIIEDRGEL